MSNQPHPVAAPRERPSLIRSLMLVLLLSVAPVALAQAALPAPACRLPTVIKAMALDLRSSPSSPRIDPALIQEAPTPDPLVVHCDVCVEILLYDTARLGELPLLRCEWRSFLVRASRHGVVVQGR